jgi:hypothetical protein
MADDETRAGQGSPRVPPDAGQQEGINPLNPRSMPRSEDDELTFARSPEYHDRPTGDADSPHGGGRDDDDTPHEGGVS